MCAALCALDTDICQQTQSGGQLSRALFQVGRCAADRQDSFAQLADVGVGLAGGHGEFVAELVHILLAGFKVQRSHGVCYKVRSIGEVHAARSGQIQHAGQDLGGLVGIVTGKCEVVQGVRCLCSGERCCAAHLFGLGRQRLNLVYRSAHRRSDLRHRRLKAHADSDRRGRQLGDLSSSGFDHTGDQLSCRHRHGAQTLIKTARI